MYCPLVFPVASTELGITNSNYVSAICQASSCGMGVIHSSTTEVETLPDGIGRA